MLNRNNNNDSFKECFLIFKNKTATTNTPSVWEEFSKGAGEFFGAAGGLLKSVTEGFTWIIKEGPKNLWSLVKRGQFLSEDTWDSLNKPPKLLELPEYGTKPKQNKGESDEVYKKRVWGKRKAILKVLIENEGKNIEPQQNEINLLERRIDQVEEGRIARLVLLDKSDDKLEGLSNREDFGDFPENSPMFNEIAEQRASLEQEKASLYKEIDFEQDWFVFDSNGKPVQDAAGNAITNKIDLKKRRSNLLRDTEGARRNIKLYKQQQKAIDYYVFRKDKKKEERQKTIEEITGEKTKTEGDNRPII